MLNEIWRLSEALRSARIAVPLEHPLIHSLPASEKNVLRVKLNECGAVAKVEDVAKNERVCIRRVIKTSDGSFPVLKVNKPLLLIPGNDPTREELRKAKGDADRVRLLTRCGACQVREWRQAGWKWNNSLEKAAHLKKKLDGDGDGIAIASISNRLMLALQDKSTFTRELADQTLAALRQGTMTDLGVAQELLVGRRDRSGRSKSSVLLVLDSDQSYSPSTYDAATWRRVAEVLSTNLAAKERTHTHRAAASAFGGNDELLREPFPSVKLPVLKSYFPLLSMASDDDKAKCNKRYRLTEYAICPVTKGQARRMQDVLTWIVHEDREGQTWRGVANGRFEKDPKTGKKREDHDLLIAFAEDKPHVDAKTASYAGPGRDVSVAAFEVDAKAIADAFSADPQVRPQSKLHFFLIRKASDGQAQLALAESPTVQQVLDAAERWVKMAKQNASYICLFLPKDKRKDGQGQLRTIQAGTGVPQPPYPDQVVRLLSYQWVRNGSSPKGPSGKLQKPYHEVVGPSLDDVLTVMLRIEGKWELAASRMLGLLLQRLTPLLIGVFGAKHAYGPRTEQKKTEPLFDYPRSSREVALRAVAVAAILLDALGYQKEQYMNNAPFRVGQLLALADTLHKDYCVVVRKGQFPSTLIGTALMRRALDNPAGAIADLGERLIEYVRWAKTVQMPPKPNEKLPEDELKSMKRRRRACDDAQDVLKKYEALAAKCGSSDLPTELDDVAKAQLLLGFLASPPDEEQDNNGKDGTHE